MPCRPAGGRAVTDERFSLLPGERLDPLNDRGLSVIQQPGEYCFSMDAVLLSHFAALRKNERAAELCAGSGVISLLMCAREPTLRADLLELDPRAASRAARSVSGNGLDGRIRVFEGSVQSPPAAMPRGQYHVAVCNPPYGLTPAAGPARELPVTENGCSLQDAVAAAAYLLRFSGRLYLCYPSQRLQGALNLLARHRFAVKRLRPVYTRPDKPAYLFLIGATLGGKEGLRFEPPLFVTGKDGAQTEELRRIYDENGPA